MAKKSTAQKIRDYMAAHPQATATEVAKKCNTTTTYVYVTKANDKLANKKKEGWKTVAVATSDEPMNKPSDKQMPPPVEDVVNHPAHYKTGGIETIDFIEAKNLNYRLGNVVKYVARADHKGERKENLLKARWYLDREIAKS